MCLSNVAPSFSGVYPGGVLWGPRPPGYLRGVKKSKGKEEKRKKGKKGEKKKEKKGTKLEGKIGKST